jgi:hypothetical protein
MARIGTHRLTLNRPANRNFVNVVVSTNFKHAIYQSASLTALTAASDATPWLDAALYFTTLFYGSGVTIIRAKCPGQSSKE